MAPEAGLGIQHISKHFGKTLAVNDVSFEVALGGITAVLGPSGCGKSTLLSIIAGLETPDTGQVTWQGTSLQGLPPNRRDFGLMFQDFALFPHMDVHTNIAFGLRMKKLDESHVNQSVQKALELVGLPGYNRRDVNTLSGGEQQRIALARSLVPQPRLLLLDEPLGALDRTLRERLIVDLQRILRDMKQTALYVTHDQEEAFTLADRVVIMNAGCVIQIGTPQEIYRQPASLFVARFLGLNNLLPANPIPIDGHPGLSTPLGSFPISTPLPGPVTVLLRPEEMRLDASGPDYLECQLVEKIFRGSTQRARIVAQGQQLTFDFPANSALPEPGHQLRLSFDAGEAFQIIADDETILT